MKYKLKGGISLALLGAVLSGCGLTGLLHGDNNEAMVSLQPGETTSLHFFTSDPRFDSNLQLQDGASYALTVQLLSNWVDGSVDANAAGQPLDESGFDNSLMPMEWFGILRRSREHNWFELMLSQSNCGRASLQGISELEFDEASGSYNFVANCDGKLFLHVNDTRGFYLNNQGYANIAVTRVN